MTTKTKKSQKRYHYLIQVKLPFKKPDYTSYKKKIKKIIISIDCLMACHSQRCFEPWITIYESLLEALCKIREYKGITEIDFGKTVQY